MKEQKSKIIQVIALIDIQINEQVNKIIHNPEFQALESAWRGLQLLADHPDRKKQIIIKVLDLSFKELQQDLLHAIEVDQSQLFKKVYEHEFDHPGGQPYGLLLGNYEIAPTIMALETLHVMMRISALSFAPFIAGVSPTMFGVDQFIELNSNLEFENLYKLPQYQRWLNLAKEEEAQFIGLTLPRCLIRKPYNQYGIKINNRFFQESIENTQHYLWISAAFFFAKIICRSFLQSGWLANIRGITGEKETAGATDQLARTYFSVNSAKDIPKISTDLYLTDSQEKMFSELGYIPLRDYPWIQTSIFYSSQSIKQCSALTTNQNTQLSNQLHYLLCVARFVHYCKVIIRDKIGKFITVEQCERYLQQWILKYCAATQHISTESKAKYPLNEAKIRVYENIAEPGKYYCILQLKPQYQLDEIEMHFRFMTPIRIN